MGIDDTGNGGAEVMTVPEAAKFLGVHRRTVLNWVRDGRFPGAYRLDPESPRSHYRLPVLDVVRFAAARKKGGPV